MTANRKAATKKYQDTTPNGNGTFDYVYQEGEQFIVVEAKGLGARRRSRNAGTKAAPIHVQQGRQPYLENIIDVMAASGGRQASVAKDLRMALNNKKLTYMEVATKKNGLKQRWFTVTNFKLS